MYESLKFEEYNSFEIILLSLLFIVLILLFSYIKNKRNTIDSSLKKRFYNGDLLLKEFKNVEEIK